MMYGTFRPFLAADFQVKFATQTWEKRGAAQLRHQVFCEEQGLFAGDDRDAIDAAAIPLVAVSLLGLLADDVVGTVRIHESEPGTWWGSRLAVAQDYRKVGALGAALIRLAVSSAHARGATKFLAHVQSQNALLFRRLHWSVVEEKQLHGRPHVLMQADLGFYPPLLDAETGFRAPSRASTLRKAA
ncbi:MSMEG_0567/Sll0786 family nitrogen starvation N-acetyltransferase [Ancylobacter sp.]|uniref:MSMEG_0567/Sll0786 family nitrogen starvation N-acetyltransferase n=1 Tax=Ancylobacter sp. TaxID=1872567 RepID=UPI003D10A317